jgi:hypothetical protein
LRALLTGDLMWMVEPGLDAIRCQGTFILDYSRLDGDVIQIENMNHSAGSY